MLGVVFITTEYRRGLIRTTLSASPQRGRVLAAKAIVIAAVTFVAGLVATAIGVPLAERILRAHGNFIFPVPLLTELRVIGGAAAILAVSAVLALAIGVLLRRSAGAVTAADRGDPAAAPAGHRPGAARRHRGLAAAGHPGGGFRHPAERPAVPAGGGQYSAFNGYYPLAPWAGLAVLCGCAALALRLAIVALRRRDA